MVNYVVNSFAECDVEGKGSINFEQSMAFQAKMGAVHDADFGGHFIPSTEA